MNKKQMEEVRNEYEEFLKNAEKEGFRELTEDELRLEVNGGRDKCKNDKDSNDGKGSEDKRDKKESSDKDKKEGGGAEKKERGVIDRIKDYFGRGNKDKDRSEAKEKSTEQKEKGLLGKVWDGIKDFFSSDKSKEEEKKAEENNSNLNKNGKAKSEENASVKSSQNDELTENSESQDMSKEKHGASDADGKNKTEDSADESISDIEYGPQEKPCKDFTKDLLKNPKINNSSEQFKKTIDSLKKKKKNEISKVPISPNENKIIELGKSVVNSAIDFANSCMDSFRKSGIGFDMKDKKALLEINDSVNVVVGGNLATHTQIDGAMSFSSLMEKYNMQNNFSEPTGVSLNSHLDTYKEKDSPINLECSIGVHIKF